MWKWRKSNSKKSHPVAPMEDAIFWTSIGAWTTDQATAFENYTADESLAFYVTLKQKAAKLHTWDHWGAAYIAMGGCGDDGFDYFKSWIISQGQTAYLAFLENADNLICLLYTSDAADE